MKIKIMILLVLLLNTMYAQQINGELKKEKNQKLTLYGYKNFESYKLADTTVDSLGFFTINYKDYKGVGYLQSARAKKANSFLVLNQENIKLVGTSLLPADSLQIQNSKENKLFKQYEKLYKLRTRAYSAWYFLSKIYKDSTIFKTQTLTIQTINNEMLRLKAEDSLFLEKIDSSLYVSWLMPLRKFIDEMPASVYQYNENIFKNINYFRNINFNDKRFYHSSILAKLLDTHFWMLENSSKTIGDIDVEMNKSTDYLIDNLSDNDELLNEVTSYLFRYFEKHSLYKVSEHLAIKMLTQNSCVLDEDLSNQLESYRAMKEGNIAPDIKFTNGIKLQNGNELKDLKQLSDIQYKKAVLVVFGASWCPKCQQELPKMKKYYENWKVQGLEVLFISLDTNKKEFMNFAEDFPWYSYCDMKGWDSKICTDYYLFGTPTMYLLDANRNILERVLSVEHVNSWIKSKLNK